MLTTEELLIPRWKVIDKWPGIEHTNCRVGDIITDNGRTAATNQDGVPQFIFKWGDYPNLFQPLQWYEERKPEDMPGYVRSEENVYKIANYDFKNNTITLEGGAPCTLTSFLRYRLPITESDYLTYKQQSNG